MALFDHCRCVSIPKCSRASRKVTSIAQRLTNSVIITNAERITSMLLQLRGTLRTFDWIGLSQKFSILLKLLEDEHLLFNYNF